MNMAEWQRSLNVKAEWEQAKAGTMTLSALASVVARKLLALRDFDDPSLDDEKATLVDEFKALEEQEEVMASEFNELWEQLYDWADTSLDAKFNGKKACWVEIF
jgi:hypothetical protein